MILVLRTEAGQGMQVSWFSCPLSKNRKLRFLIPDAESFGQLDVVGTRGRVGQDLHLQRGRPTRTVSRSNLRALDRDQPAAQGNSFNLVLPVLDPGTDE